MDPLFIFGWIGPILVVISLALPSPMWFRIVNLTGSTIAAIAAAIDQYWPFVFMNGTIALINIFWIWKLTQKDKDSAPSVTVLTTVGRDISAAGMWGVDTQNAASRALKSDPNAQLAMLIHDKEAIALAVIAPQGKKHAQQVLWSTPENGKVAKELRQLAAAA